MNYDDRYHLHLGYYENGYDLEAVAYKRKLEEVWDIYFDFDQYGLIASVEENEVLEGFGTKIFSIEITELDYDNGAKRFEQWLSDHFII